MKPAFALALLVPGLALAHSFTDVVTVNGTQATAQNPQTGSVGNRLSGDFDVSDDWGVHGDLTVTHETATPATAGTVFPDTGGNVLDFAAGAEWDATDHWSFGLDLNLSPSSETTNNTRIEFAGPLGATTGADANLRTTASSSGLTFSGSWNSASLDADSDYSTAIDFDIGGERFKSTQKVTQVVSQDKTVNAGAMTTYCNNVLSSSTSTRAQKALCRQLLPTLKGQPSQLGQGVFGLGVTETFFQDTDVGVSGTYNVYSQDPTQVGYFTLATAGRRTASLGEGVQVAPLQWTVRPDVAHRFGDFSGELWYEHGQYVPGQGHSELLGLKLSYRFSHTYKAWVTGTGQADHDASDAATRSATVAAGLRIYF